jgi:cholesterol transport system auxiliary component
VVRPRTSTALDTDRIAVVPGPSRFEYYTDVRWAEAAPQMVQQNLVAALEASGRFGGVFAAPARAPSELMLDLELRHFEARAAAGGDTPVVHVQLQASLVDARRAERVTSFVSEARVPIGDDRRAAIIAAFEQASAQVTADVVARAGEAAAGVAPQAK